jgi:hypothetical protein
MYDHSTVLGQAITVVLSDVDREGGMPTMISTSSETSVEVMEMFSQSLGTKQFKIFVVYVAKGLVSTAFVLPLLGGSVLEPETLSKWKSLSLTLPDWNEKFVIATSTSDGVPASTVAIELQEEFFKTKALHFKTPAKCRFVAKDQDTPTMELEVQLYSPFFREDEEAPITEIVHVSGVLAKLDEGVSNTDDYHLKRRKAGDAISSLWLHGSSLGLVRNVTFATHH